MYLFLVHIFLGIQNITEWENLTFEGKGGWGNERKENMPWVVLFFCYTKQGYKNLGFLNNHGNCFIILAKHPHSNPGGVMYIMYIHLIKV